MNGLFQRGESLWHGAVVKMVDVIGHLLVARLLGVGTGVHAIIALVKDRLEVGDVIGAALTELSQLIDSFLKGLLLVARHDEVTWESINRQSLAKKLNSDTMKIILLISAIIQLIAMDFCQFKVGRQKNIFSLL